MGVEYTSPGATRHFYGPRPNPATNPVNTGAKESTYGNITEVEYRFLLTDLPTHSTAIAADACTPVIPANSAILDAVLYVEAAADGTSGELDIGLTQVDGGTADVDGLFDGLVQANLTASTWHVGNGALVRQASVTNDGAGTDPVVYTQPVSNAEDCILTAVTASGSFTGGRVRLIVRYIRPQG